MTVRKKTYIPKSSSSAIFSSKMFLSSTRQSKIMAAFNDAENIELVRQLDEYLGDEYIALMKPPKNTDKPDTTQDAPEAESPETQDEMNTLVAPRRSESGSPIRPSLRDDYKDLEQDFESEGNPEAMETTDTAETSETTESEAVENSTKIKATTIIMHPEYEDAVNEIKGLLNANSTTAGVSRVQKKDDEVWIYYKDSINLNTLMDAVIEILDSTGYTWMIFNRLARTDNAIVYAILGDDTLKNIPSPPVTHKV